MIIIYDYDKSDREIFEISIERISVKFNIFRGGRPFDLFSREGNIYFPFGGGRDGRMVAKRDAESDIRIRD